MACIEVIQEIELEVAADQTVEIILSLLGSILLALIIIAIILIIRCRRVIIRTVSWLVVQTCTDLLPYSTQMPDKCRCRCCCVGISPCCVGAVDDQKDNANAYIIHSWGEPELDLDADAEMEDGPERVEQIPDVTLMEIDEVSSRIGKDNYI